MSDIPWETIRNFLLFEEANHMVFESVEIDKNKTGLPVLAGTQFKISQLLAELAEGFSIKEISENHGLDITTIQKFLHGISIQYDLLP